MNLQSQNTRGPVEHIPDDIVEKIVQAIGSVRTGQVRILVRDSSLVQIDRTE